MRNLVLVLGVLLSFSCAQKAKDVEEARLKDLTLFQTAVSHYFRELNRSVSRQELVDDEDHWARGFGTKNHRPPEYSIYHYLADEKDYHLKNVETDEAERHKQDAILAMFEYNNKTAWKRLSDAKITEENWRGRMKRKDDYPYQPFTIKVAYLREEWTFDNALPNYRFKENKKPWEKPETEYMEGMGAYRRLQTYQGEAEFMYDGTLHLVGFARELPLDNPAIEREVADPRVDPKEKKWLKAKSELDKDLRE